jgi:photosystem II stability/assembly factor-like uncharacterized protein
MYRYLHLFILLGLTLVCQQVKSQFSIELVDSSQGQTSFRGLSVVTDKVVWVSGSKGTVGLSKDGGKSWKWMQIPGFEKSDFRDIEAFDKNTAIIMASGTPAVILKTTDGGENWKVVFRDNRPEMFLDAMDFWDKKRGMLVGDPINGRFVLLETTNGGDSWRMLDSTLCPEAHDSEAVFAASGTSLRCWDTDKVAFASGGKIVRLFWAKKGAQFNKSELTEVCQGASSKGIFSIAATHNIIIGIGGDYVKDSAEDKHYFLFDLSSNKVNYWDSLGYFSSIEIFQSDVFLMSGTKGTLIHEAPFEELKKITTIGFNVVRKAKKGKAVFLAGSKGRIAKLNY